MDMILENLHLLVFLPLLFWSFLSVYWLSSPRNQRVIRYIKSSPSGFTTTGVLGTFLGIAIGLSQFDVNDIQSSIPLLLEGLKGAFLTSIFGIILSMIFQKIVEHRLSSGVEIETRETQELSTIVQLLSEANNRNESNEMLKDIKIELLGIRNATLKSNETQEGILSGIVKNRTSSEESTELMKSTIEGLFDKQNQVIRGNNKLLIDSIEKNRKHVKESVGMMISRMEGSFGKQNQILIDNSKLWIDSMEENYKNLSKHLAEMNSKELLKAMEDSVKIFNDKMEEILSRLIKENFDALNKSVNQLNDWQIQHKGNVDNLVGTLGVLIDKHQEMSNVMDSTTVKVEKNLSQASSQLDKVASTTSDLVKDDGKLMAIVKELETVLLGDNQLKAIFDKSEISIDKINAAADNFDKGLKKVEGIQKNLHKTNESLVTVTNELQQLSELKDINGAYWKDVETKMNEGVSILKQGSSLISNDLDTINREFKGNLNETFQNLDKLIKFYITNNNGN